MAFSRILVPLDGGTEAEAALPPALDIARAFGATVYLLEVTPGYGRTLAAATGESFGAAGSVQAALAVEETRAALASDYLDELRQTITDVGLVTEVAEGASATVIADYAAAKNVDLIVMATHSRSGLTRMFLGSVTEEVIRQVTAPVLVVHRDGD